MDCGPGFGFDKLVWVRSDFCRSRQRIKLRVLQESPGRSFHLSSVDFATKEGLQS